MRNAASRRPLGRLLPPLALAGLLAFGCGDGPGPRAAPDPAPPPRAADREPAPFHLGPVTAGPKAGVLEVPTSSAPDDEGVPGAGQGDPHPGCEM